MKRPCIQCGALSESTRCDTCAGRYNAMTRRLYPKTSPRARGYNSSWDRLSRKARRLQPFCSDCGATEDLQADHTPEAWRRHDAGLPIRLRDIDVVCGACNRRRGAARGKGQRQPGRASGGRTVAQGTVPEAGHVGPDGTKDSPDYTLGSPMIGGDQRL